MATSRRKSSSKRTTKKKPQKQYRAVMGRVQFEPTEKEANGKDIRSVAIRQVGVHAAEAVLVSLTVWDSHEHIDIEEGDLLYAEGSYTENTVERDDGTERVYHNLSVSHLLNLGAVDAGERVEVVDDEDDEDDEKTDDDLPF